MRGFRKRFLRIFSKAQVRFESADLTHKRDPGHPRPVWIALFGLGGIQRFFDRQGAVHARISVDFASGFGCPLEAPITP